MVWPGKAGFLQDHSATKPWYAPTLSPEESVNFDKTENLIIEGDNLEVLKTLTKVVSR